MNKVILAGRLTETPELKKTTTDLFVTSFNLAVDRKGKEKTTDFLTCVAWRGTAEFITKYFQKGNAICITGSLQTRKYTAKDGKEKTAVEIVVDEAYFVESKKADPKFEEVEGSLPF